jgi:hypothetical protein
MAINELKSIGVPAVGYRSLRKYPNERHSSNIADFVLSEISRQHDGVCAFWAF